VWRAETDFYLTQMAIFRDGDVVVDVGANVGVISIYLARRYPFIRVYAIEPDPLSYECLEQNLKANGVDNVIAINKAISGDGEKRTLYVDVWNSSMTTTDANLANSRSAHLRTAEVETLTLEALFQQYEIQYCRLLKINAPGALGEVLAGLMKSDRVDLLCGEAELKSCSRVRLEAASWRIARQHFWRIRETGCWLHGLPFDLEDLDRAVKTIPVAGQRLSNASTERCVL
jgi:FkbM family methyltransferase